MAWRSALAVLMLAWTASAQARHSNAVLDPRRATPGVTLEVLELPRTGPGNPVKYRLRVSGLPSDQSFGVWTRNFGREFREVVSGLRPDASGVLAVTDNRGVFRRLSEIEFDPGPYPRGAAWWVAIASDDHKVAAFARVVPYPIAMRDGSCSLSLELISLHGNRFVATGAGFMPGEEVAIESHASGSIMRKRERIDADGRLPPDVVMHGDAANTPARYVVKARSCAPGVQYHWGEPALEAVK